MKKLLSIMLAGVMILSLAACGGKKDAESEAPESNAPESIESDSKEDQTEKDTEDNGNDGQNPVMNFVGDYVIDRAVVTVQPLGKTDAQIHISWSSSAFEHSEWDMTGTFDTEDLTIEYEDCVKKTITFKENGELESETVDYENGEGEITFIEGNKLVWDDDEEDIAEGTVFEYLPPVGPDSDPSAAEDPVDLIAGIYEADRATCEIYKTEKPGKARILIHWASSAFEVTTWEMTGVLDEGRGVLDYAACTKTNITFGEDGSEVSSEVVYDDGSGRMYFLDGAITWEDDKEDAGKDVGFVIIPDYVPEEAGDGQNPVMNFIGYYVYDRAIMFVQCWEDNSARITIQWADSAFECTEWSMIGEFDSDTATVTYDEGAMKSVTYAEDGTVAEEDTKYTDGTGTIKFNDDGTATWVDDKRDPKEEITFEYHNFE